MKLIIFMLLLGLATVFSACDKKRETDTDASGHTAPTTFTAKTNARVLEELPLDDQQDFIEARRGLIARHPNLQTKGPSGNIIWDQTAYEFIKGEAPASVNPSLWRQAKLNNIHGLFEVTKGIYQLRGFDLSNLSIIEGQSGWIIVDPSITTETTAMAIAFAREHLEEKPVVAIIFTHSHIDHFGGALGVMSAEEAKRNKVRIIAPKGFMEEATSENIIAGIGMGRRSEYQMGRPLDTSVRGHVDTGLGKTAAFGSVGILMPTESISRTPQELIIDGIRFVFQYTPESEAPAELTFYLPHAKVFCGAEVVSRNMHNVYTLRGTKIRDALKWSNYIDEVIGLFGEAEIYFGSHHWPIWGNERIVDFLKKQRDMYKYIHDQTMRLANTGYTPREISERIKLPKSLSQFFSNRGYYGTLRHNSKAVYQAYFGWYDANPANLNPLPPQESAVRTIEFMGGADAVLTKSRASFSKGEYRWVAEVLNHLVFAEPDNTEAKELLASAYDQLGYQTESGVWRNVYLTAAYELRHGVTSKGIDLKNAGGFLKLIPVSRFFDSMAVRLKGPEAEGKKMVVNFVFTDLKESYVLVVENSVLHHYQTDPDPKANATVTLTHELFLRLLTRQAGIKDTIFGDELETSGSRIDLVRFLTLFDMPKAAFNIVTP